jgi:hypothetical protein
MHPDSLNYPAAPRNRYPLRALLAVALAWLAFAILVFSGAFFCVLLLPLVPLYVGAIVSSGGLLAAAHQYARSQSRVEPSRLRVRRDAQQSSPNAAPEAV